MSSTTASKDTNKQNQPRAPKPIAGPGAIRLGMALMAVGLLFAVPGARAETKLSAADKAFILAAAQGGMTEVKLGELAGRKGTREDVKQFGRLMVKDHTAINDDLKSLAAQKGVTLSGNLDAKHQAMVDKMTALRVADFDNAYIAAMLKGHEADAEAFKAESGETQDPDVKSFVDKSTPVVVDHLLQITGMKQ